jgi:hypothetical protein
MKDRIAITRPGALPRVLVFSLVLLLGCAAGGCDARPNSETGPSAAPPGIEKMKEQMKGQMKPQDRGKGRPQRGGNAGR